MIFHTSCRCCINVCKQTGESHVQGWRLHCCLLTSGPLRSPLSSHALLSWDTASRFSRIKMQLPAEIQHGSRYLERNRIILKQFINKIAILVTDAGTKETVCLPGLKLNYIIFKKSLSGLGVSVQCESIPHPTIAHHWQQQLRLYVLANSYLLFLLGRPTTRGSPALLESGLDLEPQN